ncbi:MAG: hypothetical protein KDA85_14950 [Planctomycetaceae bacterium]|nr:hypothetical protein [Planctomycetaceae bacterium]
MPRFSRRNILHQATVALGLTAGLSGCGTIFYPERRGQPRGRIDWTVVGMDSIGILFFLLPGVIAFAVDYANGTMFLPAAMPPDSAAVPGGETELRSVSLGTVQPSPADVERAIYRERNLTVSLNDRSIRRQPLASIDEFWPQYRRAQRS